MKVFVPMTDLAESRTLPGELVPFSPEFLKPRTDNKPANWLSDDDYVSACKRLREVDFEEAISA